MLLPPPTSTLFPYTTLFRSYPDQDGADRGDRQERGRDPCRDRHEDDRRADDDPGQIRERTDRKSTRLNSSHLGISYAVFCLKKKKPSRTTRSSTLKVPTSQC